MTERVRQRGFASRPGAAESWVRTADRSSDRNSDVASFTARLTIDITPALRGRIKVTAFQRGLTVADMLRELLAREFPNTDGGTP